VTDRNPGRRRRNDPRRAAIGALAGAVFLSACAGANLFEAFAFGGDAIGGGGPSVEITAPAEGLTVNQGASLQVAALVEAPDGLGTVAVRGVYKTGGGAAFAEQTITYQAATVAEVNRTLASTNGGAGAVYLVVVLTDAVGEVAADSVSITIN
jgi:hypothetical protein